MLYFLLEYRPSLIMSMFKAFGVPFALASLLKLIHDICQFMGPFMLEKVINFLSDVNAPTVCILLAFSINPILII